MKVATGASGLWSTSERKRHPKRKVVSEEERVLNDVRLQTQAFLKNNMQQWIEYMNYEHVLVT